MIRMIQCKSANNAKEYFSESLLRSDYYLDAQEFIGAIRGNIARRIGIQGDVTKDVFHALCENINPVTGKSLTPKQTKNRTVGYDINFHCPKSVSVLHALSKDAHILDAFQKSVLETMTDIEKDAKTRVRKKGKDENRSSEGLLYADFIHQTARPVKGEKPDPHLHCHCFVFNVTWDQVEKKFKAGQFRDIKRDMPYYQALFHKRLADNVMRLGYDIKPTKKAFEIEGVPDGIVELFSKRTNEIGQIAKDQNITDAKELDQLGSRTRYKKDKGLTIPELKKFWIAQIKSLGLDLGLSKTIIRHGNPVRGFLAKATQVIDFATLHLFERASVVHDRRLLEAAIRHSIGSLCMSIDGIQKTFKKDERFIRSNMDEATFCTTHEIVQEEKQLLDLAISGKHAVSPHYKNLPFLSVEGDQKQAVELVLTTPNRVSIIMGRAGTGKTNLMQEAVSLINKAGKSVLVVAPTAQASRGVLRDEGFENAETVSKLLTDKNLQASIKDQVLWVDEAGLLGTKDMLSLLQLTETQNAQLILSGDTRQHSSVVRGDALRFLRDMAGVQSVNVNKIYRQKRKAYREAIEELSSGNIEKGFAILDSLGAIIETDPDIQNDALIKNYSSAVKRRKSVLIVSPTHNQSLVVTKSLRKELKDQGVIGKQDIILPRLSSLNLTQAERQESKFYQKNHIVQFTNGLPGFERGSYWTVDAVENKKVQIIDAQNNRRILPLSNSGKFDVYQKVELPVAKGDRIQITRNGKDINGKKLNNGQEYNIKEFRKDGSLLVQTPTGTSECIIPKDYGHLNHAYCVTSHSSQGKTVDHVILSQPSSTFPASDLKQFYVSASRGRESITIYTDDKVALLEQVRFARERKMALELVDFKSNAKSMLRLGNDPSNEIGTSELFKLNQLLIYIMIILFQLLIL